MAKRIKSVEHEEGWGWIARNPFTGEEIMKDFRWTSRSVARSVVAECRMMTRHSTRERGQP